MINKPLQAYVCALLCALFFVASAMAYEDPHATLEITNETDYPLFITVYKNTDIDGGSFKATNRTITSAVVEPQSTKKFPKTLGVGRNVVLALPTMLNKAKQMMLQLSAFRIINRSIKVRDEGENTTNRIHNMTIKNKYIRLDKGKAIAKLIIENNTEAPITVTLQRKVFEQDKSKYTAEALGAEALEMAKSQFEIDETISKEYQIEHHQVPPLTISKPVYAVTPGRNAFVIKATAQVSPYQRRSVVNKAIWVNNRGIRTFLSTYRLVITDKDFTDIIHEEKPVTPKKNN